MKNVDAVLIHCNVLNNIHKKKCRVLYSFVPDVQFGQLINVKPESLIYLKATSAGFSFIEVWFKRMWFFRIIIHF